MEKILSNERAKAIYDALCMLNNAHVRACDLRFRYAIVSLDFNGMVHVIGPDVDDEHYDDQAAFAEAYGLV